MHIQNKFYSVSSFITLFFTLVLVSCSGLSVNNAPESVSEGNIQNNVLKDQNILATWESKPKVVSEGNGLDMILKTSEGMNFIYAKRNDDGQQNLMYTSSHNMGDTFAKAYPINQAGISAHGENDPVIQQGPGIGMFALWQGGDSIMFSSSMNFGRSFSPETKITDGPEKTSYNFQTMSVSPDGTIFVAWLDGRDKETNPAGTSSLYIARSFDRGKTFGANIKVAGAICPCCRPALAFGNDGQVFISWRHVYSGDNRFIVVSSSSDKGQTWSKETRVTKEGWKVNGCAHSGPTMNFTNGKLYVAWYSGANNKAALKAAVSSDNGQNFDYLGEIQGSVYDANHPDMQIIEGEPWLIFQGREPDTNNGWGNIQPWLIKISDNGKPSKPEKLPFLGDSISYPSLYAGSGGRIYATWTEIGENGPKAVLCRGRLK
jgi:hypothetical protein